MAENGHSTTGPVPPLLLDDRQAAAALAISRAHFRSLDKTGCLPRPIKLGSSTRWALDELRAWAAQGAPDREKWEAQRRGERSERPLGKSA